MKRVAWYVGGLLVVGALVAFCAETRTARPRPESTSVAELRKQNQRLRSRNSILVAHNATVVVQREKALRERDSLKVVSDAATKELRRARAAIPSTPTAAQLPGAYRESLRQLDVAIAELARKDEVIRQDSILAAQAAAIERNLREQVTNLTEMVANASAQAREWETQYIALQSQQSRCGRKCGMVIGGAVVVLTAIGAKKVQEILRPDFQSRR